MNDNLTGTVLPSSNGVVVKEDNVDYTMPSSPIWGGS